MKNEPTFLELVLDIISEQRFNKLNEEEKQGIYQLLEENYQKRIEISYRQGFTAGKFEGTNEAIKLLNTK